MDNSNVLEVLGQADFGSAGEIFRDYIRTATRDMIMDVMQRRELFSVSNGCNVRTINKKGLFCR